jgi:hypothetical protein
MDEFKDEGDDDEGLLDTQKPVPKSIENLF